MPTELATCPNCDSETGAFVQKLHKTIWRVKCLHCGTVSQNFENEKGAIEYWNYFGRVFYVPTEIVRKGGE